MYGKEEAALDCLARLIANDRIPVARGWHTVDARVRRRFETNAIGGSRRVSFWRAHKTQTFVVVGHWMENVRVCVGAPTATRHTPSAPKSLPP